MLRLTNLRKGLLIALVTCATPEAFAYNIIGAGSSSCGKYTSFAEDSAQQHVHVEWALGYLTAFYALSSGGHAAIRPLREIDGWAARGWLNNYCKQHPLDDFALAAFNLARELAVPLSK
jgi:hypothetical protein